MSSRPDRRQSVELKKVHQPHQSKVMPVPGDAASQLTLRLDSRINGTTSNLAEVKKSWNAHLAVIHGIDGHYLENGSYHLWEEIAEPVVAEGESSMKVKMLEMRYLEAVKRRDKHLAKLELERHKDFAFMSGHISVESLDKAKSDSKWATVWTDQDPLALFQLLERTHLNVSSDVAILNIQKAEEDYRSVIQGPTESLARYHERVKEAISRLDGFEGHIVKPTMQAANFISRLDAARYKEFVLHLKNMACTQDGFKYPETLASAFDKASKWSRLAPTATYNGSGTGELVLPADIVKDVGNRSKKMSKSSDKVEGRKKIVHAKKDQQKKLDGVKAHQPKCKGVCHNLWRRRSLSG